MGCRKVFNYLKPSKNHLDIQYLLSEQSVQNRPRNLNGNNNSYNSINKYVFLFLFLLVWKVGIFLRWYIIVVVADPPFNGPNSPPSLKFYRLSIVPINKPRVKRYSIKESSTAFQALIDCLINNPCNQNDAITITTS